MNENVELFRRVIERGFNEGDLSVADESQIRPARVSEFGEEARRMRSRSPPR